MQKIYHQIIPFYFGNSNNAFVIKIQKKKDIINLQTVIHIQTQEMRNSCEKINWDMCCLDATGSTNQYRWLLYSIIIGDEGGHGIPLAFMITSWESHEPITKFFEVLHITVQLFHKKFL